MNQIPFPLDTQSQGQGVADLQAALKFLLDQGVLAAAFTDAQRRSIDVRLAGERARRAFGTATSELVQQIQELQGLTVTGLIDKRTAASFNALLADLGSLTNEPLVVSGVLLAEAGGPIANALVRAYHEDGRAHVRLGEDQTDKSGRYTVRCDVPSSIKRVQLRVSATASDGRSLTTSPVSSDAQGLQIVELVAPVAAPDSVQRQVAGKLALETGVAASRVRVLLYRNNFGGGEPTLISEATTAADGSFWLPHDASPEADSLQLRVQDAAGKEFVVSRTLDGAQATKPGARLGLVAPASIQPLESEFARLQADLTTHLGPDLAVLGSAVESAERQDLSLLQRRSGWDARLIALLAKAIALSADPEVGLTTEQAYALLRAGLPSDKLALATVQAAALDAAIDKAVGAGIVNIDEAQRTHVRSQFDRFAKVTRLTVAAPGSNSTYKQLLDTVEISEAQKQQFADVLLAHRGASSELWAQSSKAGLSDVDVSKLRLNGKLSFLTGHNALLVRRLQSDLGAVDLPALVAGGFHEPAAWIQTIKDDASQSQRSIGSYIPSTYQDPSEEARLAHYAADMSRKLRLAFPNQVIESSLQKDERGANPFNLPSSRSIALTTSALRRAIDLGFQLGRTPVKDFVRSHPIVLGSSTSKQAVQKNLEALTRTYQMAPSDGSMKTLMRLGLTSARDVVAISRSEFLSRYADQFPDRVEAELVYAKASQISGIAHHMLTLAAKVGGASDPQAMTPSAVTREAIKASMIKRFPTMETLFGAGDFCECQHCRSVLSPAAYLVNLLQFIDPDDDEWQRFRTAWRVSHAGRDYEDSYKRPFSALMARRPDIPHVPLTCENTHTALPYIDIFNGIIEYHLAHGGLDAHAASDTGAAASIALLTEPQHVIVEAYDKLAAASFPINLPFDLWLETTRAFCNHFDIRLWRLLEATRPTDQLYADDAPCDRSSIFIETLGLSPAERRLLTGPDALTGWHRLYGYASEAAALTPSVDADTGRRQDLHSARTLASKLGVSYQELVTVLKTPFVNPRLDALVALDKLGIGLQDAFLLRDQMGLYDSSKDLLDRRREDLTQADQARFDDLNVVDPQTWIRPWEVVLTIRELLLRLQPPAQAPTNAATGFDALTWLQASLQNGAFDDILLLREPEGNLDFGLTVLQLSQGGSAGAVVFLRLNILVRLWRRLGWPLDEVATALWQFIPRPALEDANQLVAWMDTALVYLSHLDDLARRMSLGKRERVKLLTFWGEIPAVGAGSLYAEVFLNPSALAGDTAFDHPQGLYLSDPAQRIADHLGALQAALGMTASDVQAVLESAGLVVETAALSMGHVSLLYRHLLLAKGLKLSITQLFDLIRLSGIDPFTPLASSPLTRLEEDQPYTQTLRFIEAVDTIKSSGLKVPELLAQLQHVDGTPAPLALVPDKTLVLGWIRTLAQGLRAISAEHAVPADPGGVSDELLARELGLVLAPEVVATLLAMLNGTVEYRASTAAVPTTDALDARAFDRSTEVRLPQHDTVRQTQALTVIGVLTEPGRAALQAKLLEVAGTALTPSQQAVLARLLGDAASQARAFFDQHLLVRDAGLPSASGFLQAEDFDVLFTPPAAAVEAPADDAARLVADQARRAHFRLQRSRLVAALLPSLRARLVRQFVVQHLSSQFDADPLLVETLLCDAQVLGRNAPILDRCAELEAAGITVRYFESSDGSGEALPGPSTAPDVSTRSTAGDADATRKPAQARSVRFSGYLEVPTPGAYRFIVSTSFTGAALALRFDHLNDLGSSYLAGTVGTSGGDLGTGPNDFIDLVPGKPYRFTLEADNLSSDGDLTLQVQGQTLGLGSVDRLTMYPDAAVHAAQVSILRMHKVVHLCSTLALSASELRYLATHAQDFAGLDLNQIPVEQADNSSARSQPLFEQLLRLCGYVQLRQAMVGEGTELVDIFGTATREQALRLISQATGQDLVVLTPLADLLLPAERIANELTLRRLWDALQVRQRLGISVADLAACRQILRPGLERGARAGIANRFKDAVRARLNTEEWQALAKPIFDRLRQRQRDALVACTMNQLGLERIEQLYEHFLMDPGMQPVVETSRIRLAISSVQLFIQRCLLNLEPDVPPSAIDGQRWEWMKRYRVWEANRKIFLFPENFLEPELRDDKSPLFNDLEGSLLQGDVSTDLVEDAFFNYLKKLEELSQLTLVAMHIEADPGSDERVVHLFGRTSNQPYLHFYRRHEAQRWTPWEALSVQLDGEHLAPVVWRGRLYLFWLTFVDQPADVAITGGGSGRNVELGEAHQATKASGAFKTVALQLHWIKYQNGEWSSPEVGPLMALRERKADERPRVVFAASEAFRRVQVSVATEQPTGDDAGGVFINLSGTVKRAPRGPVTSESTVDDVDFTKAIYLASPYSVPEFAAQAPAVPKTIIDHRVAGATRLRIDGTLSVSFIRSRTSSTDGIEAAQLDHRRVLSRVPRPARALPANSELPLSIEQLAQLTEGRSPEEAQAILSNLSELESMSLPFCFQERNHGYFVQPDVREQTLIEWDDWVPVLPEAEAYWGGNDEVLNVSIVPASPSPRRVGDLAGSEATLRLQSEEDWLINDRTALLFGNELIGPMGRIGATLVEGGRVAQPIADEAVPARIHPASGVLPGKVVHVVDSKDFGRSGIETRGHPLNVVGHSGLNAALARNLAGRTTR